MYMSTIHYEPWGMAEYEVGTWSTDLQYNWNIDLYTFWILSSQALHALLLDLAYSISKDLSSPPSTSLEPACELSADNFPFIFSWSSQRRESKPLISATSLTIEHFLKKQLKWNQLGT